MTDGIDRIDDLIAALRERGDPMQVQWAGRQTARDEGTIVVRRDGDAVVVTQLGRVEAEDRVERFGSERDAAEQLRRRLLDPPVRRLRPEEREEMMERTRRHAEETQARLARRRGEP